MFKHRYDKNGECSTTGQNAEDIFEQWLIKNNRKYRKATVKEQYNHIDFVIYSTKLQKEIKIDIKGPKKVSRNDKNKNSNILWVEFVSVNGSKGSLYGENDYLAFYKEDENSFYILDAKEFAKTCEKLCNKGIVYSSKDALYHKYTRRGRKDVISMIYFNDIKKCKYSVIKIEDT